MVRNGLGVGFTMKTKKLKNVSIITIGAIFTSTIVISLGFLSFVGFYLLIPSIAIAFVSMILASIIESSVIFQNIVNALQKAVKFNYIKKLLAERYLNKLISNAQRKTAFMKEFLAQQKYVVSQSHRALSSEERKKLEVEVARLKMIKKQFRFYLFRIRPVSAEMTRAFDQIINKEKKDHIIREENRKKWIGRAVVIPVIIAAISCGVVTYMAVIDGLTAMLPVINSALGASVSVASFTPAVLVFSLIACLAFCFQIYNAAMDMIYNDSLYKLKNRVVKNLKKGGFKSVLYGLGVLLLLGLGVFVTIATVGTWWYGMKKALDALNASKAPATLINIVSITFFGIANIIFNFENTNNTLGSFESFSLRKTFQRIKAKVSKVFARENFWQRINPFRALLFVVKTPFRIVGFILHILSVGAISDNFGNKWVSFAASSITEGFEDYDYIIGHTHNHSHKSHETHNHSHVDVIGWVFLAITFIPLYLPCIIWDWTFSKLNQGEGKDERRLTFVDAWRKTFSIKPKVKELQKKKFELSTIWDIKSYEVNNKKTGYKGLLKENISGSSSAKKEPQNDQNNTQKLNRKAEITLSEFLPEQYSFKFFLKKSVPLNSKILSTSKNKNASPVVSVRG